MLVQYEPKPYNIFRTPHQICLLNRIFSMNSIKFKIPKRLFLFTAFLFLPASGWAHDFWLAPEVYAVDSPEIVNVSVMIGHPEDRLSWPVAPHRVVSLRTLGPDGIRDQQAAVLDYKKTKNLPIRLKEQGLHILTIETTNSISVLAAEKFTARSYTGNCAVAEPCAIGGR